MRSKAYHSGHDAEPTDPEQIEKAGPPGPAAG